MQLTESGSQAYLRAYDPTEGEISEHIGYGIARTNLLVQDEAGGRRIKLQDITVDSSYRGGGISSQMLNSAINYGHSHGATEIYGTIDDVNALSFWKSQTGNGWSIVNTSNSIYGEVHYKL